MLRARWRVVWPFKRVMDLLTAAHARATYMLQHAMTFYVWHAGTPRTYYIYLHSLLKLYISSRPGYGPFYILILYICTVPTRLATYMHTQP